MNEQLIQAQFCQARDVRNLPPHFVADFLERAILNELRPFVTSGHPFTVSGNASGQYQERDGSTVYTRTLIVRAG